MVSARSLFPDYHLVGRGKAERRFKAAAFVTLILGLASCWVGIWLLFENLFLGSFSYSSIVYIFLGFAGFFVAGGVANYEKSFRLAALAAPYIVFVSAKITSLFFPVWYAIVCLIFMALFVLNYCRAWHALSRQTFMRPST